MKQTIDLKQFEYSVLPSPIKLTDTNKIHKVSDRLPLMRVLIDFENGKLKLDGDWGFMISSNEYNETGAPDYNSERMQIETEIYGSSEVDLDQMESDSLTFFLDGNIKEGNSLICCSGLLTVEIDSTMNGVFSNQWNVVLSIHDLDFQGFEVNFKLPIFFTNSHYN